VFEGGDATSDMNASDAANSDGGVSFQCGAMSVSSCAQCNNMSESCVYCGANNALTGRCVAPGMSCSFGAPAGFGPCNCTNASSCPESFQVCRTGTCRSCADSNFNAGQACKGGGTCNPTDGGCN
jgi:hypothetical protein